MTSVTATLTPASQWVKYVVPQSTQVLPDHRDIASLDVGYLEGLVDGLQLAWEAAQMHPPLEGTSTPKDYFMALSSVQNRLSKARQLLEATQRGDTTSL